MRLDFGLVIRDPTDAVMVELYTRIKIDIGRIKRFCKVEVLPRNTIRRS